MVLHRYGVQIPFVDLIAMLMHVDMDDNDGANDSYDHDHIEDNNNNDDDDFDSLISHPMISHPMMILIPRFPIRRR